MASPFTIYSKNKIYRKSIVISPILKRYLFKIRDISHFREIFLLKRDISFSYRDISLNWEISPLLWEISLLLREIFLLLREISL
jgi:hypothetical protein